MTVVTASKKKLIFDYLDTPEEERIPQKQFLKENGMIRVTFYKGEILYAQEKEKEEKEARRRMLAKREAAVRLGDMMENALHKSEEYLDKNDGVVDDALVKACKRGNAGALKLYYQLTNRLIEKSEVKVGLSADERARRNLQADVELLDSGYKST